MTAQTNERGPDARVPGRTQGLLLASQGVLPTMGVMLLVPVLPLIFAEYGDMPGAAYWIPAMLTVPALCIALFSPLAGILGDRFGRRTPLIIALCLYGCAGLAPLALDDFFAIFASRIILGLCEAVIVTLSTTLIGDYFTGTRRDRYLALITTIASLSAIAFLGISGVLGQTLGWRGPFLVYGLSLLFVPAMLLLTWATKGQATIVATNAGTIRFPWKHLIVSGATTLFGSSLFYVFAVHFALALSALGAADPARIGLLSGIASIATPVGTLAFMILSKWRSSLLLTVAFTTIGAALIAVGQSQTDVQSTIAAFVGMFGCGLLFPTLLTWTMRSLSFENRGSGTGVFQSMFSFGQFASAIMVPFLTLNVTGNVLGSFATIGVGSLGAAIIAMIITFQNSSQVQDVAR